MALLNPVSCSYKKCGSMINSEEDLVTVGTSTGNDYYHRGCWLGIRLKEARETVSQILPGALRLRMFHKLRGHDA